MLVPILLLVLLAASGTLLRLRALTRPGEPRRRRLPPSPRGLPIVGNLHQLAGALPHRALHALAAAHGPVMLLRLGRVPTLVVSSPAAAREVLHLHDAAFAGRPPLAAAGRLLYGRTDIAFAPHGAYWRRARKMCVLHLLSPRRVRACRAVREEEVAALLRRVAAAASGGGAVPLSELLGGFAKDAIGRIVLGVRASGGGGAGWRAKVDALLEEANALLGAFHVGDYFPRLAWVAAVDGTDARARRAFERIDGILEEIVAAASAELGRAGARHDAFVHVLLSIHKDSTVTGPCFTRDNVKALLEDLFGAGTDSTIIVLEWVMAELLRNPDAMRKLQLEVRRRRRATAGGGGGGASLMVTEDDLPAMEYLRAVVKETMRLHPPGPLLVPRESMADAVVGGGRFHVPRGTRVVVNAWAVGRDPAAWDRAGEFRPARFAGGEVDFRGRHFQLVPFGAGRRMCPGIGLASAVVELAVANLVARFDWAVPAAPPAAGGVPEAVDMEEAPGITSRKKVPLRVVAAPPA
ncbi:hypothetical protein ACP4OV_025404 [Aristida adscensionis]